MLSGFWLDGATASAATITVTTTSDTTSVDGAVSLREAIGSINAGTSVNTDVSSTVSGSYGSNDTIVFNIAGGGVQTVNVVAGGLPALTAAMTIDGYTQPGATPNTNALSGGSNAVLRIELNGASAGASNGLTIHGADVTIRGLVINRFALAAIAVPVAGGSGAKIEGNFLGTNATGATALANGAGVSIADAPSVTVGGTQLAARNLISGNVSHGVRVDDTAVAGNASYARVQGNLVGTDATGESRVRNGHGIIIYGPQNATIGGAVENAGNVISANTHGIIVQTESDSRNAANAVIQGNLIGTNAAGDGELGNEIGISVYHAPGVKIGGTTSAARNVVSGNSHEAIRIDGAPAAGAVLQGNYIGTNAAGAAGLASSLGVRVLDAPDVMIGGTSPGAGNVISGNVDGISVYGVTATGALIQGNLIGTDASGTAGIMNGVGVAINAPNATVGGTMDGARNVISANVTGIAVGAVAGAVIQGNYIGANSSGTAAMGNVQGISVFGATGAQIGGTAGTARNVIVGSALLGISLGGSANGTVVQGNYIGVGADGVTPLGSLRGITVDNTSSAIIGGVAPGEANIIANHAWGAVWIASGTGNRIRGNSMFANGLNSSFTGLDLGGAGVTPNDTGDGDSGPNGLQNYPVLASASVAGGETRVTGSLNSAASSSFTLDFYANPTCHPSGHGEGKTYLGSKTVTTDGTGNATFSASGLAGTSVGHTITATATDSSGNTSEFSACRSTVAPGMAVSPTTLSLAEGGPSSSFTVALTAVPTDTVTVSLAFDASQATVSPSTLTFRADATATVPQTVTVAAVNDSAVEGTQSLDIVLSSGSSNSAYNGLAGGPVAVTLLDNDGAPTLSVADLTVGEPPVGTSSASVTVALTPASPYTVTVQYATANGASPTGANGGSSCADGIDFANLSGVLTFNPGETSKTVDVTLCADSASEPGEAFAFNLAGPTGGAIVGRSGTVTITDHQSGSCQTSLTAAVPAGTNRLPVTSSTGCAIGQTIVIDRGLPSQESVVIAGYGSLILDSPTKYAHVAGAGIVEETQSVAVPNPVDDSDKPKRESEEQRQQRERTNRSNKDDYYTEGNVVAIHLDEAPPYVVIANRDGLVKVVLLCGEHCPTIRPGDYLEVDGEKQHEQLFEASDVTVTRRRR